MAYDRANHRLVLFGGTDGGYLGDTWTLNLTENAWRNVTPASSPPGRTGHSMVYDRSRGLVVLFGGRNGGGYLNDTWAYDTAKNTWTQIATPVAPGARECTPPPTTLRTTSRSCSAAPTAATRAQAGPSRPKRDFAHRANSSPSPATTGGRRTSGR